MREKIDLRTDKGKTGTERPAAALLRAAPLADALRKHQEAGFFPFHIPGHKGGAAFPPLLKEKWGENVLKWDLTELPGLDDLHAPHGAIAAAQEAAAQLWGAAETFFLVNGSSAGIEAMLWAAAGEGERVLLSRQAHRSALGGLILSGAWPVYLETEIDAEFQIPLGFTREELRKKLTRSGGPAVSKGPDAPGADFSARSKRPSAAGKAFAAAVAVYPNVYGVAEHLKELAACCRGQEIPVLADEAWGAHFLFHSCFPQPALAQGAEAAVQSWHKMLGSLTQSAVLHCRGELIAADDIRKRLLILQSTSPSYLLLASLDAAREWMEREGKKLWELALEAAQKARREIGRLPGLACLDETVLQHPAAGGWDPVRLTVKVSGLGLSGFAAADFLARECRLQVEMADAWNVVAVIGPGEGEESAERLTEGFKALCRRFGGRKAGRDERQKGFAPVLKKWPLPPAVMTPRQAFLAPAETVLLREARGKVAAEMVCPYPPGIPLLAPGEKIEAEILEMIAELKAAGARWQGTADASLDTLRVVKE